MYFCDTQIQTQLVLLAYFGTTFWETMQELSFLGHHVRMLYDK